MRAIAVRRDRCLLVDICYEATCGTIGVPSANNSSISLLRFATMLRRKTMRWVISDRQQRVGARHATPLASGNCGARQHPSTITLVSALAAFGVGMAFRSANTKYSVLGSVASAAGRSTGGGGKRFRK